MGMTREKRGRRLMDKGGKGYIGNLEGQLGKTWKGGGMSSGGQKLYEEVEKEDEAGDFLGYSNNNYIILFVTLHFRVRMELQVAILFLLLAQLHIELNFV